MPDLRTSHPYYMHDAILAQPERIDRMLRTQRALIERAADAAAARKRIIFAGIGTSLNAARLGAFFLRALTAGRALVAVEQSFELIHYPLALGLEDAVILTSHRGWKNFSVEALKRAKAAGALTIAITGELGGEGMGLADFRISTCEQENSFAHTKSFTTALAALALFAVHVAQQRKQLAEARTLTERLCEIENVPAQMRAALACEAACSAASKEIAARPRLLFVGAGPQWTIATEAALKVKETSYFHAEGLETEEFLHGPFSEMDARASLVALLVNDPASAQPSPAFARLVQALRAVGELGVQRVAIVSTNSSKPPASSDVPAERVIGVPAAPEWLSPFTHVVPVQFLSYYLALARGTNPDTGRQHEPAHARAQSLFKL
ncbi:MAG: SIS domain-containing protein [Acidobacteria bacterium]|nr:SIS domain-containing protein [Acidobacteriota bacterium]MCL5289072.1 SIS domain-containing protein [Acidobacteriota bacterium]